MALAVGYQLEGTLRDNKFKAGKYHDECVYSMLEDEYYAAKAEGRLDLKYIMKRVAELRREMRKK